MEGRGRIQLEAWRFVIQDIGDVLLMHAAGEISLDYSLGFATSSEWWAFLPTWLQVWEGNVELSKTAFVRRLPSGKILTYRLLPESPVMTTIEFVLYARAQKSLRSGEFEIEALRRSVQVEIDRLELKQDRLLSGHGSYSRGRNARALIIRKSLR